MATRYFKSGVSKFNSADHKGAVEDYTKAIGANVHFTMTYANRGDTKRHRGDEDGAISAFSKSLELNPQPAKGWGNRGLAKTKRGDVKRGGKDLKTGSDLDSPISKNLSAQRCQ